MTTQITPELEPHEAGHKVVFHLKIAVSRGYVDDWAMYLAPGHWSDQQAAREGQKVYEAHAEAILRALRSIDVTDLRYEEQLSYRP